MNISELTTNIAEARRGEDTLPRAAERLWENRDDGIPIVDAQGRLTGVLVTARDIRAAWRAARGAIAGGVIPTMCLRSDAAPEDLDLIGNDVSVFFVGPDGLVQQRLPERRGDESPVSLGRGSMLGPDDLGAFMWHARTGEGYARRERSESFGDHYRDASLFWNSLSVRGRAHLVLCARFELGKVESRGAWRRAITQFRRVDGELARRVASGLRYPGGEAASAGKILVRR